MSLFLSQVTKLIEDSKGSKASKSAIGEDRILDWLVNEKVLSIALEGQEFYYFVKYEKYSGFYARKQNASRVFAIIWASVRLSVRHTRELYQNGASQDHEIFTMGCPKVSSLS